MRLLTFLLLCVIWGTTWIGIKISLEGLPPFQGAALRFTVALILLSGFIIIKKIPLRIPRRDFLIVSASAFLMYTLDYGLIYWGEQFLSAGVTAIFFATFPLFTGLGSAVFLRQEKLSKVRFFGLLLGMAGITIVFLDQLLITQFNPLVMWGALAVIGGAAGGALSIILVKKYLTSLNPVSLSFHQMLQGTIFLYFFSYLLEPASSITLTWRVILAVIYLGALGSALAFALYYWLLQQWSPITLSLIIYITPLVALVVDYLIFREVIHPRAVVGMLIIFGGITFVQINRETLLRMRRTLAKIR